MAEEAPKTRRRWYSDGLCFSCTQCGKCCTGFEGYVWLDRKMVNELADYLGITEEQMMKRYVRRVGRRLSLIEKPNFDCVFWEEGKGCTVYSARPTQCRTFPFWKENLTNRKSWDEVSDECPGVDTGREYTQAEIERISAGRAETGGKP